MINRRTLLTMLALGGLTSASPIVSRAILAQVDRLSASQPKAKNSQTITFYVAPNGNDKWSGKSASPNSSKTDGPFATIARSRNAIRELKRQQGGTLKQPITVLVRGGTYFLTAPLVFTPEDSGIEDFPITYAAYEDEKPIISGGRRITGWKPATVNDKQLWVADLSRVHQGKGKWGFRQLWVNGQRRILARYPNEGYLQVAEVPDATSESPWQKGQNRFRFRDDDLKSWRNIAGAEVVLMSRWFTSYLPVNRIDEQKRLISFSKPSIILIERDDLYYLENALEFLDSPGEWYLERETSRLYYHPMPDEDMNDIEVIAPVLASIVRLNGRPEKGQFVEYLNFSQLSFAHTARSPNFTGYRQAGIGVSGQNQIRGDVIGNGVRYCNWKNCTISHIGNYALELASSCHHNRIIDCEIFDLGTGGIKIGSVNQSDNTTHSNEIINCHIHDGGRIVQVGVGIWIGQSYNNRIARNHVHDFYYTGISVGWTFGYGRSQARDNIIETNHIHHIGLLSNGDGPLLDDKGAIYTLGVQPGTIVRSNVIHDINASRNKGWGIYLDEGSSQIVVENNLIYRTISGGFHIHYGKDNLVRNNIFAFGEIAQIVRSRNTKHLSFTFENNIVYWDTEKLFEGQWDDYNYFFDRNLYWQVRGGEILFNGLSWNEWQARGMDENSLIAEPEFVDPKEGDFELQPDSPAFKLGFQSIQAVL